MCRGSPRMSVATRLGAARVLSSGGVGAKMEDPPFYVISCATRRPLQFGLSSYPWLTCTHLTEMRACQSRVGASLTLRTCQTPLASKWPSPLCRAALSDSTMRGWPRMLSRNSTFPSAKVPITSRPSTAYGQRFLPHQRPTQPNPPWAS